MHPKSGREALARIIDPIALEEFYMEDGRVDPEVASIFEDAVEEAFAKADAILALLSRPDGAEPVAWRWRYYGDGRPVQWTLRQSPIQPRGQVAGLCAIEVQPLFAHPLPDEGRRAPEGWKLVPARLSHMEPTHNAMVEAAWNALQRNAVITYLDHASVQQAINAALASAPPLEGDPR